MRSWLLPGRTPEPTAPEAWPWPRLWPTAAVGGFVVVATVLFVGLDVLAAVLGSRTTGALGPWAGLGLQLAVDLSLLTIARVPRTVALVVIVGTLAVTLAPALLEPVPHIVGSGVLLSPTGAVVYTLAQLRDRRWTWPLVGVLTVLALRPWDPSWPAIPLGLLSTLLVALAGRYVDARRRLFDDLHDRADRTDREQRLLAERARAEERERLAAEMHDVVSHRVSLMVLQAGALEVTASEEATRSSARALRGAGIQALDELRELVGVLRAEPPTGGSPALGPTGPAPDVTELVDASRAAGLEVALTVDGDAAGVPPALARTAHRVVQEALTNVHKHAPGSSVAVEVGYRDPVRVAVRNTASDGPDPALAPSGSGSGLRGLRERVELIGGTLHAGPEPDGGFAVLAELGGR